PRPFLPEVGEIRRGIETAIPPHQIFDAVGFATERKVGHALSPVASLAVEVDGVDARPVGRAGHELANLPRAGYHHQIPTEAADVSRDVSAFNPAFRYGVPAIDVPYLAVIHDAIISTVAFLQYARV